MLQYCILTVEGKLFSSKKDVLIDLGDEKKLIRFDKSIIERTMRVSELYTLIDALNYLGEIGWELVHVSPLKVIGGTTSGTETTYLLKISY